MMWNDWMAWMSSPERTLQRHPLLARMGPFLRHPDLWQLTRASVARGVAIGVFFGFLIPLGQIPAAAVLSIPLRANVGAAVAGTLVTNPVTFPPIYLVAYRLGSFALDRPIEHADERAIAATRTATSSGLWGSVGKPLALGLCLLACTAAPASYLLVMALWTLAGRLRRKLPEGR
jgi:uncharacterized protein